MLRLQLVQTTFVKLWCFLVFHRVYHVQNKKTSMLIYTFFSIHWLCEYDNSSSERTVDVLCHTVYLSPSSFLIPRKSLIPASPEKPPQGLSASLVFPYHVSLLLKIQSETQGLCCA